MILPSFRVGGAERQALELGRRLPKLGWRPVFLVCEPEGPLREEVEAAGIRWHGLGREFWRPRWSPLFWLNLTKVLWRIRFHLKSERAVVAQSFLYWENVLLVPAAFGLPRVRAVITGRRDAGRHKDGRPFYQWLENVLNRVTTRVVCNSEGVRKDCVRREKSLEGRLVTIPNGVDTERFLPPSTPAEGDWIRIGTLGNLKRAKRHDILLKAFAFASARRANLRLVIGGDDRGELAGLKALASELGLEDRVEFVGRVADAPGFLQQLDLFALTSDHEGMPNVVLEAMSCAVPVVARRVEGVDELLAEGGGMIVDDSDPAAFGRALLEMAMLPPPERLAIGREGRRRMVQDFSLERMAGAYGLLYNQLTSPRRIAMMIGSMREGGAEGQLVLLAGELRKRGYDVLVMLLHHEGSRLTELQRLGVETFPINLPRFRPRWSPLPWIFLFSSYLRTVSKIYRWRPDVVHAWLFWAHLWSFLTLLPAPRSVRLLTSRLSTPVPEGAERYQLRVESWINRRADGVWANSAGVARVVQQVESNLPACRAIIRNGLDVEGIEAQAEADLAREFPGLGPTSFLAVHVASLIPVKAHEVLIEAWGLVAARNPQARVLCIGADGGEGGRLRARAKEMGLAEHVIFTGPRADVPSLIKAADVGILCSHREGLSNAMLEYMVLGKPPICTDVNGAREAIIHGQTGLIVPCADPQALAEAVIRLMEDPAERRRLGAAARDSVRRRFGVKNLTRRYERLLRAL